MAFDGMVHAVGQCVRMGVHAGSADCSVSVLFAMGARFADLTDGVLADIPIPLYIGICAKHGA